MDDGTTTPKQNGRTETNSQLTSPNSLNEMESKMRDEIRRLQERRVAVLMDEVMQLQSERDNTLLKISNLENENQKLIEEISLLKETGKPSVQVAVLEKALQQEKDEKNKLKQRLRVIKRRNSVLSVDTNLTRERSSSMNDMNRQDSSDHDAVTTSMKDTDPVVRAKRLGTKSLSVNTPSPRPKRYVLAATTTMNASTQTPDTSRLSNSNDTVTTNMADNDDTKPAMLSKDMIVALSEAKSTILEVLQEKETIELQLANEKAISSTLRENLQGPAKALEKECELLKRSFKQFHQWVNSKLSSVQEEMDICKVIYSLHRSLSQEATLIEQLTEKVQEQKRFIAKLQSENSILETKLVSTRKDFKSQKHKQRSGLYQEHKMSQLSNQLQQPEVMVNAESPVV